MRISYPSKISILSTYFLCCVFLIHSFFDGESKAVDWSEPEIIFSSGSVGDVAVDIDADGVTHAIYWTVEMINPSPPVFVHKTKYTGGDPEITITLEEGVQGDPEIIPGVKFWHRQIFAGTDGCIHVAYVRYESYTGYSVFSLRYAHNCDDGEWSEPVTLATFTTPDQELYNTNLFSMGIGPNDEIYFVWVEPEYDFVNQTVTRRLKSSSNPGWGPSTLAVDIDPPAPFMEMPEVAFTPDGDAFVIHLMANYPVYDFYMETWEPNMWGSFTNMFQAQISDMLPEYSLTADALGNWHIVYRDGISGNIIYRTVENDPVSVAPGSDPYISIDPSGKELYITYRTPGSETALIRKCIDDDDADGDNIGNLCDPCPFDYWNDSDNDGICGNVDNCVNIPNEDQEDADEDEIGDACDECTDMDGDTYGDPNFPANTCVLDNCPMIANADQDDGDGDGVGDACTFGETVPAGFSIVSDLGGYVTLSFEEVTVAGSAELELTSTGPQVTGFQLVPAQPPIYYNISSTATYTGDIEICVHYEDAWVDSEDEAGLAIYHFDGNDWVDITTSINTTDNIVCGYTPDLSPFVLAMSLIKCGDANGDGSINVGDAVYLINYVFKGGPAPEPECAGDANGDGNTNVGDAVYLINHIFKGGPAPLAGCC